MTTLRALAALATLLCMTSGAFAQAYNCAIREQGSLNGYVAPVLSIFLSEDGEVAVVEDSVIRAIRGRPLQAQINRNSSVALSVSWVLEGLQSTSRQYLPHTEYRALLEKNSGDVRIHVTPAGYDDYFIGRGTCRVAG